MFFCAKMLRYDFFNFLLELLQVKPTKNNGTAGSLSHIITSNFKSILTGFKDSNICEKPENWTLVKKYMENITCFSEIDKVCICLLFRQIPVYLKRFRS